MASASETLPILFVNTGVQILCFSLPPDEQIDVGQALPDWQYLRCEDNSEGAVEGIVQYGYIQWQAEDQKLFLAVDTTVGTAGEGHPEYFSKIDSVVGDQHISIQNVVDDSGNKVENFPNVEFIMRPASADAGEDRHVHLVVDFGNSRTGGLLVEFRGDARQEPLMTPLRLANRFHLASDTSEASRTDNATWWFSSKTHWSTTPYQLPPELLRVVYDQPETTSKFGKKKAPVARTVKVTPNTFREFSQARMGREADELVGEMDIEGDVRTGLSSPKRYLWADDDSWLEGAFWRMADPFDRMGVPGQLSQSKHVAKLGGPLLRYITEDDSANDEQILGSQVTAVEHSAEPRHAPRCLMQAALYELLCQAFSFVNSTEYQKMTGDRGRRRILYSMTLTFPSGMIGAEREQLKRQAEKATAIFETTIAQGHRPLLKLSIDEASSVHLTYLWSESRKLGGKPSLWFSVMGHREPDSHKANKKAEVENEGKDDSSPLQKSRRSGSTLPRPRPQRPGKSSGAHTESSTCPKTRIACIDIGGGTSDLMIAQYQCETNPGGDRISGNTLHRDGVSSAGDHLVKRLLERIIVPYFCDVVGFEQNHINFLFGSGGHERERIRRQKIQWMNRLFVPLAHAYLDAAVKSAEAPSSSDANRTIISHMNPDVVAPEVVQSLQDTINKQWQPGLYNVKQELNLWYGNTEFEMIVDEVFGELLFDFCESIVEHKADVVLLAGLPTKLPFIRELIESYLPLANSRIVPMHGWYSGTWYPYQNPDHNNPGVIVDPKSTVVVGAAIEFCARHGKLPQFNFEMSDEAAKSSYYWGVMTESRIDSERVIFTPRTQSRGGTDMHEFEVTSENLMIGRKRRPRDDSQASSVYRLRSIRSSNLGQIKFKVQLQRELDKNDEEIIVAKSVEGTVDDQPAVLGKNVLFDWRTLADERYYLDTGELDKIEM